DADRREAVHGEHRDGCDLQALALAAAAAAAGARGAAAAARPASCDRPRRALSARIRSGARASGSDQLDSVAALVPVKHVAVLVPGAEHDTLRALAVDLELVHCVSVRVSVHEPAHSMLQ